MGHPALRILHALVVATGIAACTTGASVVNVAFDASASDIVSDATDAQCGAGQTSCGGSCVATATSAEHCGACGRSCRSGEACQNGACVPACAASETLCGSADAGLTCANLMTDSRNCGVCGRSCEGDRVCSSGVCTFMCRPGLTECTRGAEGGTERYCADAMTDRNNCGACGNACMDGYACEVGRCRLRCEELRTACPRAGADAGASGGGEFCTNTSTDLENCGMCGNACRFGQLCSGGTCATMCGAGLTNCEGICRDLQTDTGHCGMCGAACPAGQTCAEGRCTVSCGAGLTDCMGACRDLSNDNAHCGACGTACPGGQVCSAGMCRVSCSAGTTHCDGACRDLQTDRLHCGACGNLCPAGQICAAGTCQLSCAAGSTACGGVCRDLQTDNAHCGACGTACPSGTACSGGACRVSCAVGLTDCAGVCRDLRSDNAHCGACDNACAAGTSCASGACATVCAAGLTACAGVCRDLRDDNAHCGACGAACPSGQHCSAGSCAPSCASPGPTAGLWGWWRFDGDLRDSSGNGRHAFVAGNAPVFDPGGQCGAVSVDPARPIIDLPDGRLRRLTLSARLRPQSPVTVVSTSVFDGWTGSENVHISMVPRDGRLYWSVGVHDNVDATHWLPEVHIQSTQPVADNRWTHIAVTFDGSTLRLYVDGRLDASAAQPNNPYVASVPMTTDYRLGIDRNGTRTYRGLVDELRLYDRPLGADEIAQLAGP